MVTLNELKKERMILRLPDSNTRNLFVAHLESNNMSISDFNVVLEIDNMATNKGSYPAGLRSLHPRQKRVSGRAEKGQDSGSAR